MESSTGRVVTSTRVTILTISGRVMVRWSGSMATSSEGTGLRASKMV